MNTTLNLTHEYAFKLYDLPQYEITDQFESIWKSELGEIIDNPDEFLEAVYQTHALISGSFLLSCIYRDFDANDVDIYLKVPKSYLDNGGISRFDRDFTVLNYMRKNKYIIAQKEIISGKCEY